MADVKKKIILETEEANASIIGLGRSFDKAGEAAEKIGDRLKAGVARAASAVLGERLGGVARGVGGAAAGAVGAGLRADPFQSRLLAGAQAGLGKEVQVPVPGVGFLRLGTVESILGVSSPETLAQFRGAQASAQQVQAIAQQLGEAGGQLSPEEAQQLFDAIQGRQARGLERQIGAARAIDTRLLQVVGALQGAMTGADADIRADNRQHFGQ